MSSEKISIFDTLGIIDKKQYAAVEDENLQKQFVPFLTMRWMTGSEDASQIFILNEVANPYMFSLHKHKPLLWKLLCAASSGTKQRYAWIKGPQQSSKTVITSIVSEYYRCTNTEAESYLDLLSEDDILEMATYLGKDKDEVTKLKAELKKNV